MPAAASLPNLATDLWCTTQKCRRIRLRLFGRALNKIVEIEGKEIIVEGCLGLSDAEVFATASRGRYLKPKRRTLHTLAIAWPVGSTC
jgi:hypothetical protein